VIAVIVGFPVALVVSWFYEFTPQGIKRETDIGDADTARASGKRMDRWIIAALLLAVVLLIANQFVAHRDAADVNDRSIAVLPFENLSEDKANGYFTDGIQDEILTRLAKIGALKVISRTSTKQYAAHPTNLGDIARQLGVANILEGSVQKAGDAVHINVQLIKASSDDHLWAESYSRKLDDVFGVEGEVAGTIAETLNAKLSGGEQQALREIGTANSAAHDAYLRGLSLEQRVNQLSHDVALRARDYFADAVRLDPKYAQAWAHLSIAQSYLAFNALEQTPDPRPAAKEAADTALRLGPQMGEAYLALGYYHYWALRDLDGGLRAFEQARQLLPNDPEVLGAISLIERRKGNWTGAVEQLERAVMLDPRNLYWVSGLAGYYFSVRRYDDAEKMMERALNLAPEDPTLTAGKAAIFLAEGKIDKAQVLLDRIPWRTDVINALQSKLGLLMAQRRFDEVIEHLRPLLQEPDAETRTVLGELYLQFGLAQLLGGHADQAKESFAHARDAIQAQPPTNMNNAGNTYLMAFALVGLGECDAALREAQHSVTLAADDGTLKPRAGIALAQVQAWCGQREAALAALPHLLEEPDGLTSGELRFDQAWQPLHDDARYQKLAGITQ